MILLVVVIIFIACFLLLSYRAEKANKRRLEATLYWCDMGDKFLELRDDPSMTSAKWKEWLPLFEDADRRFEETHPYIKDFFRYSEAVKREIANLPFHDIGSS